MGWTGAASQQRADLDQPVLKRVKATGEETWARRVLQQVGERPKCAPTNWVAGLLFGTEAQVLALMSGSGGYGVLFGWHL